MNNWTPLYRGITVSSIWDEPDHVRLAWISILVTTEQEGICPIKTAKGLAAVSRISLENATDALKVLSEPDRNAPSQEWQGRRIELVPDEGIRVLNWQKYRVKVKKEADQEANRKAQEKWRNKDKLKKVALDYEPAPAEPPEQQAEAEGQDTVNLILNKQRRSYPMP